jgi:dUTP pyrophosphatase
MDLRAAHDAVVPPAGGRVTVGTGLAVALPPQHVALVHPRSGLAARHGVTVLNAPGTVDAGYRGEIKVTLLNTDRERPFEVRRGDRIAQIVFQSFETARFVEVETLPGSARGEGGFGSTGTHS